jgi:sugar phosphate isomerase/epimerase
MKEMNVMIVTRNVQAIRGLRIILSSLILFAFSPCRAKRQTERDMKTPPPWGICTSVSNAEKMKAAGYNYVEESVKRFLIPEESDTKFEEKLRAAEISPLQVYSYNGFLPGTLKSTGLETDHNAILKYAKTAFIRAQQLDSKIIVFGSGGSRNLPEGFSHEKGTEQFTALLKRMGPIAAKYDITVVIEPLNNSECNFINTVREATDIAKAVDHPNIAVLADIYHMAKESEGPDSIRYAGKLLGHCHMAEREGRTMPGTNNYDFTPYLKALKDIHYQGRLSLEGRWDNFDEQLAPVIAYLNEQWVNAK